MYTEIIIKAVILYDNFPLAAFVAKQSASKPNKVKKKIISAPSNIKKREKFLPSDYYTESLYKNKGRKHQVNQKSRSNQTKTSTF